MCDTVTKGWTEDYIVRIVDDPAAPPYPLTAFGKADQNDVWIDQFKYGKILAKTGDNGGLGDFTNIKLKLDRNKEWFWFWFFAIVEYNNEQSGTYTLMLRLET
ncbi:MAG: hypothetical protein IPH31_21605 [Lewinellaceae bacterium]|nr:hypothetical protein [Lewinellaceae bacterium]